MAFKYIHKSGYQARVDGTVLVKSLQDGGFVSPGRIARLDELVLEGILIRQEVPDASPKTGSDELVESGSGDEVTNESTSGEDDNSEGESGEGDSSEKDDEDGEGGDAESTSGEPNEVYTEEQLQEFNVTELRQKFGVSGRSKSDLIKKVLESQ